LNAKNTEWLLKTLRMMMNSTWKYMEIPRFQTIDHVLAKHMLPTGPPHLHSSSSKSSSSSSSSLISL
jgi:hypothetical protein